MLKPLIAFSAVLVASHALAQTDPMLLIKPWPEKDHWADTYDEPMFINGGHLKETGEDIDILYYDSFGRIKFDRAERDPNFWLGYRVLTISLDQDIDRLPGDLNDVALAAAFKLGEWDEDWKMSLALGAGTANDGHWSNGDAVYGIATLNATHVIDNDQRLHIGVDYNGNRGLWPDVPLPYVMYENRLSDDFAFRLGVPSSGVVWRPTNDLTLRADYTIPRQLKARASLALSEQWSVFGEYAESFDGFFVEEPGVDDDERIFYEMNRVAAGVRWINDPWIDIRLGAGYAFDQRFSTGFDVRDTERIARPSDELLFFFTVQGTF